MLNESRFFSKHAKLFFFFFCFWLQLNVFEIGCECCTSNAVAWFTNCVVQRYIIILILFNICSYIY